MAILDNRHDAMAAAKLIVTSRHLANQPFAMLANHSEIDCTSVATIIAIHDISRYVHNIVIQKQCSSCRDIGLISADMLTN